jgi:hypothetical protein
MIPDAESMIRESKHSKIMPSNKQHLISVTKTILAPSEHVYAIIADYHKGHPSILPPQFTSMAVERGGVGAGTIIRFTMRLLGRTQRFRAAVTEPEPGRVLLETYLETDGMVTSFIVDPEPASGRSQVTISTSLKVRGGILGKIERFLSTKLLYPIYVRELELLALRATAAN